MIKSLDNAWDWYHAVRTLAYDMKRLARLWNDPALEEVLGRDNRFRDRTAGNLLDLAEQALADLDDIAVLVLFSVFEATVRALAQADIDRETALISHPAVLRALDDLKEAIANGSFGKVTEAYKKMDVDLTTEVNQVRKFRNWVAHGRRDQPENYVDPVSAIGRLRRYLERLERLESASTISPSSVELGPDLEPEPGIPPDA